MLNIQTTQQLDAFVRSTSGIYHTVLGLGRRLLDHGDSENRLTKLIRSYFQDLSRSRKVYINMDQIEFRQLARIYIAESRTSQG